MKYFYGAFYDSRTPHSLLFKKEQPAHSYKIYPIVNHGERKTALEQHHAL